MPYEVHCPKCNGTQLSANKKGFSGKKAVAGAVLTGGVGLLAGTIGSNKIIITCLNCGYQWGPGEAGGKKVVRQPSDSRSVLGGMLLLAALISFIVGALKGIWLPFWVAFLALIVSLVVSVRRNKRKYAKMSKYKP